jgi:hypothetical protein
VSLQEQLARQSIEAIVTMSGRSDAWRDGVAARC